MSEHRPVQQFKPKYKEHLLNLDLARMNLKTFIELLLLWSKSCFIQIPCTKLFKKRYSMFVQKMSFIEEFLINKLQINHTFLPEIVIQQIAKP